MATLVLRSSLAMPLKFKLNPNFQPLFSGKPQHASILSVPPLSCNAVTGTRLPKSFSTLNPNSLASEFFNRRDLEFSTPVLGNPSPCRSSKQYRRVHVSASSENKSDEFDYDLFTIGAGSGGVRASRFSTQFGAKAAICELPFSTISSDSTGGVGGTCVLRGCVPKKLLVYGSHFHHDFESSKGFGWSIPEAPVHDWQTLMRNKNKELLRLTNVYRNTLANAEVELIEGRGKIIDAHTVEVNSKRYTAKNILICTGGKAFVPDIPGKEYVITSDEALDLPDRPDKIVIVGSGYIALEFACIFRNFTSEVHLIYRQSLPLRGFDEEIRQQISDRLNDMGIILHSEDNPSAVEKLSDGNLLFFSEKGLKIEADAVMFATGRKPNTQNLGLEEAGVEVDDNGAVIVDKYSRTNIESIWAVGDVTNRYNLTPVALMEGMAFAKTAFLDAPTSPIYRDVPCAVFTQPPISAVGLTEEEAVKIYGDIDVYTTSFRPLKATLSGLYDRSFMKLIVDVATDKVIGAHMCGDDSPEIIQGIAIAVRSGCTKADFDATVGIHPSAAEEFVTMRTPTRKIRVAENSTDAKQAAATSAGL